MNQKVLQENLLKTIEYQNKSIVSRQIIKKPNGNITLFAFDKDEALSEHTSPFDAVVNVIDGIMEIRIDGKPYDVVAGEYIVMPANLSHSIKATEQSKMILTMIK